MNISFRALEFKVENGQIRLHRIGNLYNPEGSHFAEVQIAGEVKGTHMGAKMARSSEWYRLIYRSHTISADKLCIVQESSMVSVTTVFEAYGNDDSVRVHTEVKNISDADIVLEEVAAFFFLGIGENGIDGVECVSFTKFIQSHHAECQTREHTLKEWGLFRGNIEGQKRLSSANVGSWSTKEELPQGIITDNSRGSVMFQIESNASWYYEIADMAEKVYLYLGGANLPFGSWYKTLAPGETYCTVNAALAFGNTVEEAISAMTAYRRHISGKCLRDAHLPVIFNEYMHLSWDSPTAENTRRIAPVAKSVGAEYYVIDCGWHNEEPGCEIYPYVGQWRESKARFPEGVRATTDFIRSLGMKAGLWIEPEIIGIHCREMLDYYDDGCFIQRHGRRIAVMGRYFLDYRNERVRSYMTETIRRMVEDYGADYIKFDYNQDLGVGTDKDAYSFGEGLELSSIAFAEWVEEMTRRFPEVIFEGCASGGMRMDYKTLSLFPLLSTSDQTDYLKYPYIASNILSAVIPEQAAVWSYPVGVGTVGLPLPSEYNAEWVAVNISDDRIAMNMINSFLGRMHLASHLELLNEHQLELVKEGVEYYKSLSEAKKGAIPYMPLGFTDFGAPIAVSGFEASRRIYLAVWNLSDGSRDITFPIKREVETVSVAYPKSSTAKVNVCGDNISVNIREKSAVFLEINKKVIKSVQKDE